MAIESVTPPYMASTAWYKAYVAAFLASESMTHPEATAMANHSVIATPRELCRTTIAGAHGQPPLTLSVPILGGARSVKHQSPECWGLSNHGRWRSMHLGALQAAYGNTAFYTHCMEYLLPIQRSESSGYEGEFALLSHDIHRSIIQILNLWENLPAIRSLIRERGEFATALRGQYSRDVIDYLSIFDVIMHKGEETIFTLI